MKMRIVKRLLRSHGFLAVGLVLALSSSALGQGGRGRGGAPSIPPLGDGPWEYMTFEGGMRVRFSVLTKDLVRPWSMAFLPNGDIFVTERPGRLRIIRNGALDPEPVQGIPEVRAIQLGGLLDIALHPDFASNGLVYMTYSKSVGEANTTALARGRWDGRRLVDTADIFVAEPDGGTRVAGSRMIFAPDGTLFMTVGGAGANGDERAQNLSSHAGKILRMLDDGSPHPENPFFGREGMKPEIYSWGHRNPTGLYIHPETGGLWAAEQGPQGGDEVNVIQPGKNYGWPLVTYGRDYDGSLVSEQPWRADLEAPEIFWVPSIALTGGTFYTGDLFPAWQGNLFVGGMIEARIPGTGHMERIVFNPNGEVRRESLLGDLHQRIRHVAEGPDGVLYILTDEPAGAVLTLEPVQ